MSRAKKLAKLKKTKALNKPETVGDLAVFIEKLEGVVADFRKALGLGIEVRSVDDLIEQLSDLKQFKFVIASLDEAIQGLPKTVKIENVDGFLEAVSKIKIEQPHITVKETDYTPVIKRIIEIFVKMNKTIEASKYVPSQKPQDFIPYRRVLKKGNIFVFDDTQTPASTGGIGMHGGGGSGAVPTVNGAVPVVNPDGSNVGGGSSGAGLTDEELRATAVAISAASLPLPGGASTAGNQSTANTHLSNIATYLENRFGGGKTSVPFTVTASGDTTIHTPAAGKAIRVYSIDAVADPDESTTPLIKMLIGSTEKLRGHAFGKWEIFEGSANEVLKINLSASSSVSGTVILKEFTP